MSSITGWFGAFKAKSPAADFYRHLGVDMVPHNPHPGVYNEHRSLSASGGKFADFRGLARIRKLS
jgi:hypothetical protein